mmetsp:Transcript_4957/g.8697  ORF Transcript_4957/g.8697 Transcript_4957/m.8697 type:complete len:220 (-) Transcript_4957:753-1412(-)
MAMQRSLLHSISCWTELRCLSRPCWMWKQPSVVAVSRRRAHCFPARQHHWGWLHLLLSPASWRPAVRASAQWRTGSSASVAFGAMVLVQTSWPRLLRPLPPSAALGPGHLFAMFPPISALCAPAASHTSQRIACVCYHSQFVDVSWPSQHFQPMLLHRQHRAWLAAFYGLMPTSASSVMMTAAIEAVDWRTQDRQHSRRRGLEQSVSRSAGPTSPNVLP